MKIKIIYRITLPNGKHLLTEKSVTLPENEAYIQLQNNPTKYVSASRENATSKIRLLEQSYECARCNLHFYSNEERTDGILSDFYEWVFQLDIPEAQTAKNTFFFTPTGEIETVLKCPHCGRIAEISRKGQTYLLKSDSSSITISQMISRNEISAIPSYYYDPNNAYEFPLTVNLVFNNNTHRTLLHVFMHDGLNLTAEDITEDSAPMQNFAMRYHLSAAPLLKKTMKDVCGRFYNNAFPFEEKEICLELLILLNRFQGFPKNFYESIPFENTGLRIDKRFALITERLSNYARVPELYEQLGLPKQKSIRKVIFNDPALLFYADVILGLPFRKKDVLQQILKSPSAYVFLSTLAPYPNINTFIVDMIMEKGETVTWAFVNKEVYALPVMASKYLLFTETEQKSVLSHKMQDIIRTLKQRGFLTHNFPLLRNETDFGDEEQIGPYMLSRLKNTQAYRSAASDLRNCLAQAFYFKRRIIGVRKHNKYVAAIKLSEACVLEALTQYNQPIENDRELYPIYLQWMERHGLCQINNPTWE